MKLEDMDLKKMIEKAREALACEDEIAKINQYGSMKELLENASPKEKAGWAYWYARFVLESRWPEAEKFILADVNSSYGYAAKVVKGRCPEVEPIILTRADYAVAYAVEVMKERWPEAEPIILQDGRCSFWYAKKIIKARWPEAEPIIAKDSCWQTRYEGYFKCRIGDL